MTVDLAAFHRRTLAVHAEASFWSHHHQIFVVQKCSFTTRRGFKP